VAHATSLASPAPNQARPRWLWLGLIAIALIVVAVGVVTWQVRSTPRQLIGGATVNGRPSAPDFALTDQLGRPQQLSQLRGKPVALTFLYTNCPDVCPVIAANLHQAYRQLGDQGSRVALVAVSVDPEHDTLDQVRQFSDRRSLTDEWYFLIGQRPQLEQVWKSYGIVSRTVDGNGRPVSPSVQNDLRGLPAQPAEVEHAAPVFLIDKTGALRAMLPVDVTPDTLTTDLRILLAE
jgi:protein SCO1/2